MIELESEMEDLFIENQMIQLSFWVLMMFQLHGVLHKFYPSKIHQSEIHPDNFQNSKIHHAEIHPDDFQKSKIHYAVLDPNDIHQSKTPPSKIPQAEIHPSHPDEIYFSKIH